MVDVMTGLSAGAGLLGLFGGIGLLMWIDARGKTRERELSHTERLKALEMGQPLPDAEVAHAHADASRAWAGALAAVMVPLGLGGIGIGATAMSFSFADAKIQLPLLSIIWGVCGLVSLIAVSVGLSALQKTEPQKNPEAAPKPRRHTEELPAVLGDILPTSASR